MNIGSDKPLVRWAPKMEPKNYRTFGASSPLKTHYRPATCQEVNCQAYANGWSFDVAVLSKAAYYKVTHAGKHYRKVTLSPTQQYLVFSPEQPCFDSHVVPLDRPEILYTGRGDWRIFNRNHARVIKSADEFADRFGTHVQLLREHIKRG